MNKATKIILLMSILVGNMLFSFADRGIGKKSKNKIVLNIATNNSFKTAISLNLRTGLKYKGNLLSGAQQENNQLTLNNLVTYQKGNTIYIVPNKQKILIPEVRQGYTGMKLIIKSN